ncbi:N-acetylneuraminate lyase-like isoform X2 [Pomacea canaliculata]|uniref:N-acetylneuraminate lyase-like isoform X2 n=1 Tax=Pomacea canaliculata TaxID=400727 RepID=UPI000D73F0E5|nr:N-acetylneuraminate lyase-like isoform X2 [Pomacea canaliculata]
MAGWWARSHHRCALSQREMRGADCACTRDEIVCDLCPQPGCLTSYTRCRDLEPAVDTMTTVKTNVKIGGILAAPLTPFTRDGDVWMDALPQYARYLDTHDIDGVFILGTMGEGMSLTVEERKRVAEAWMTQIADTLRLKTVIVQVGAGNLKESVELARHAEEIGATAIACMSPSYFKPTTEEVLVEYMATVAAAAPTTPFYYYDINFMTGLYLNTARFLEVAGDKIPSLAGGKISSRELPTLLDCTLVAGALSSDDRN